MKRHRILGALTLGASVPIALIAWRLLRIGFPLSNLLFLEKLILVVLLAGAGLLLWLGHRAMYWTATAAWAAVAAWCISSLIVLVSAAGPPVSYAKDALYLALAAPMLTYFAMQLRSTRNALS